MSKSVKLRIEEYFPAGSFLKTSFVRDRAQLLVRFSEFTPEYEAEYSAQLLVVKLLEQALVLTEEQKEVTASLYVAAASLNNELNFVSFYFKRAKLDSRVLSKVKRDLAKRNIEGACLKLAGLVQYVKEKHLVLESKGMSTGFAAELEAAAGDLETKNEKQNKIMNNRKQLHKDNSGEYVLLYGYVSTIAAAGKVMYKGHVKADEYTITKLISRMRGGNGHAAVSADAAVN